MLTAVAVCLLVAQPYMRADPKPLSPAVLSESAPVAGGLLLVQAESTGYAFFDDWSSGISRGAMRYGVYRDDRYFVRRGGFLLFRPDALPESAVVESAELAFYQFTRDEYPYPFVICVFLYEWYIGGRLLLRRILDGQPVSQSQICRYEWNRFTLSPEGLQAIDSCHRIGDLLALGVAFTAEANTHLHTAHGNDGPVELRPYLQIRYLMPYPDVGAEMLIAPADTVESGTPVMPQASVRNYSTEELTFPVRFEVGTAYAVETTLTLAAGAVETVRFASWLPEDTGRFVVKCSTMLAGDEDPTNDCITGTVVVRVPDGIGELPARPVATRPGLHPSPARDRVWLSGVEEAALYAPDGRRAAVLRPGENDVRLLAPGVYFFRADGAAAGAGLRKVIVQR